MTKIVIGTDFAALHFSITKNDCYSTTITQGKLSHFFTNLEENMLSNFRNEFSKVNEKVDMVEVEVMISYTLIASTNIIKVMEPHDLCKLLSGLLFLEQDLGVN